MFFLSVVLKHVFTVTGTDMTVQNTQDNQGITELENVVNRKGMVLPFHPLSLSFDHVNYYVDMPAVSLYLMKTCYNYYVEL